MTHNQNSNQSQKRTGMKEMIYFASEMLKSCYKYAQGFKIKHDLIIKLIKYIKRT